MTGIRRSPPRGRPWRRLPFAVAVSIFLAAFVSPARAQLLQRPVAFRNARILTTDGALIENGILLIKGEKIVALGSKVRVPILAKKIDARGATVTPGLIDAFSALGVGDSAAGPAGATRRAEDAFDRYGTAPLVEALAGGVTAVYVSPRGPAGVCGTGAVVRLAAQADASKSFGRVLQRDAALCIDLGSGSKPVARLKTLASVRRQFRQALEYRQSLEEYEEDLKEYKKKLKEQAAKKDAEKDGKKDAEKKDSDAENGKPDSPKPKKAGRAPVAEEEEKEEDKKEAKEAEDTKEEKKPKKPQRPPRKPSAVVLLRAIDGEMPVRILAHRSEEILNALELAEEFSFRLILEGATEAHLVADQIADAEVPVVLGRTAHSGVRRDDPFRRASANAPGALRAAGVRWIVGSGADGAAGARFVAFGAQLAAAADEAANPIKTVTADAAEVLGVADRIGRLRPGLLADFVLWSGNPLDPASKVLRVYVGGGLVYEAPDESEKGKTP